MTLYYYSLHSLLTCEDIFVNMFLEDHYRNVNNMGTNCTWENRTIQHMFSEVALYYNLEFDDSQIARCTI